MRSTILGVVWVAIGLALTWFSYSQRLISVDESGVQVLTNEQGMLAGYAAMGFGVFWLAVGVVAALRTGRSTSA